VRLDRVEVQRRGLKRLAGMTGSKDHACKDVLIGMLNMRLRSLHDEK
jgi:hypothetical protein